MRSISAALSVALVACWAVAPVGAQETTATAEQRVELSNFDFTPREIHMRAGQPTTLVLSNTASGGHNFAASEFFAAARLDPADAGLVEEGEVEVPGKSTRAVHLVPAAGTYKLTCTHTFHAAFGMKGTIVVD